MQTTLTIDFHKLDAFKKRVAQMQRKATKLGFKPISIVSISEPIESQHTLTVVEGGLGATTSVVMFTEVDVVVEGELPVFDGWKVLCQLEHTEDGVLVHGPDAPDHAHLLVSGCEHCNTKRARKKTYLIKRNNEEKQVGGECLKDYTRSTNPAAEFNYAIELTVVLAGESFEAEESTGVHGYLIEDLIAVSVVSVADRGYVSGNDSWTTGAHSTKEVVLGFLDGDKHTRYGRVASIPQYQITDEATEKAAEILKWARANESDTNYWHNVRTLLANEYVSAKNAGYLVGLVPAFAKHIERQIRDEYEAGAVNEFVGEPKQRLRDLKLRVQAAREFENEYGTKTLLVMRDDEGRTFKWWATSYVEADQGDTIVLDGTVKAHEEYNGTKQTVLTRCKIKETVSA